MGEKKKKRGFFYVFNKNLEERGILVVVVYSWAKLIIKWANAWENWREENMPKQYTNHSIQFPHSLWVPGFVSPLGGNSAFFSGPEPLSVEEEYG